MGLLLSSMLSSLIKRLAGDKDVELFIAELLSQRLDPEARVELYLKLFNKYFREAEELYSKEDLPQAGEKYWGAVVSLLNVMAELCKWPHYSHRDYLEVVENLVDEMKDENLTVYFASAERLHVNFYHNFLRRISFDVHRRNALKLIEKLKGYVSSLGVEFPDRE